MPTHEKVYQHAAETAFGDVSTPENQADWWTWFIVQLALGRLTYTADLTGAAISSPVGTWTVAGSSDGTTAGMDGVDRWTATFNAGKIVHALAGNAHSWIVLANAALGVWITFDCATTATGQMIPILAFAAPTGGTTTARPTSTSEVTTGSGSTWFDTTAGSTRKARGWLCTDGTFFACASKDGGGLVNNACYVLKFVDMYAADPYAVGLGFEFSAGGILRGGSPLPILYKEFDGTSRTTGVVMTPTVNGANTMVSTAAPSTDRNGQIPRFPPSLVSNSTSYVTKGRIPDLVPCGKGADDTGTIPSSGPITDVRIGAMTIPANAAMSL